MEDDVTGYQYRLDAFAMSTFMPPWHKSLNLDILFYNGKAFEYYDTGYEDRYL